VKVGFASGEGTLPPPALPGAVQAAGMQFLAIALVPLWALMSVPVPMFLLTLAVMLFRPACMDFCPADRIAFSVLVLVSCLRAMVMRRSLRIQSGVMWPMLGLTYLSAIGALSRPFDSTSWSVVAAQFVVPFALFWISGWVFEDEPSVRWLERFSLGVLAYLIWIAVCFLLGAHSLIVPQFILDPNVGIHADRARGPFLQAVANGMTLNILGLLAIERYRRGSLRGIVALSVLALLPMAIFATNTRSVWLTFAISVSLLMFGPKNEKSRRSGLLAVAATFALLMAGSIAGLSSGMGDRASDHSSAEFRLAAYQSGWEMFLERPLTGWTTAEVQTELARRIDGFHGEAFAVHNTFLAILMEHGIIGLGLYLWLFLNLFRLRKARHGEAQAIASIRAVWPLLLGVYLLNAGFVIMNYVFVNGVLFTYAGILASRTYYSAGSKSNYEHAKYRCPVNSETDLA